MSGAIQATSGRLTAEQRRGQLFAVALELFAQRGYRATTMDDIAEAAGVTKPLLYQHFSSKRALYLELVDSIAQDVLVAIGRAVMRAEGPRQQVELGFAAYFGLVVSREPEFRLLYGRDHADDFELGRALRASRTPSRRRSTPSLTPGSTTTTVAFSPTASWAWRRVSSRRFMAQRPDSEAEVDEEAQKLAGRMADLAWAGLRSVHPD